MLPGCGVDELSETPPSLPRERDEQSKGYLPGGNISAAVNTATATTGGGVVSDSVQTSSVEAVAVPISSGMVTPSGAPYPLPASSAIAIPLPSTSSTAVDRQPLDENQHGYVGLVNQAMTCYLNSLLQTLYMTPEFRNALYKWQFTGERDAEERNIPYQLQKLFLLLQTSDKCSLETKDLTRSFGWDSSDAWDQHDVQELCRLMFDALESRWKHTKESTLIQDLYKGSLKDYVKCLQCERENARIDAFLDLPLPVKPFGAVAAYGTVEEAIDAFVKPELLTDNNAYQCEHCGRKTDAHKGLKFVKFPYLLTIQLKRFDFDYTTLARVKLNDKMTFPDLLNLNHYVTTTEVDTNFKPLGHISGNIPTTAVTIDDKLIKETVEEVCAADAVVVPPVAANDEEEDEGIEMSCSSTRGPSPSTAADLLSCGGGGGGDASRGGGGPSTSSAALFSCEVDESSAALIHDRLDVGRAEQYLTEGPYVYELFSIMVHSGSANGGHYYAYIKNIDLDKWYCFNDSSVKWVDREELMKSYGGTGHGWAFGNTNAYMLMYRKLDRNLNDHFTRTAELPSPLLEMLNRLKREEEEREREKAYLESLITFEIYCDSPSLFEDNSGTTTPVPPEKALRSGTKRQLKAVKSDTVAQLLRQAAAEWQLGSLCDDGRLRLFKCQTSGSDFSLSESLRKLDATLKDVFPWSYVLPTLYLDWRETHELFVELDDLKDPHTMALRLVDLERSSIGPVRRSIIDRSWTVLELKEFLALRYKTEPLNVRVVVPKVSSIEGVVYLDMDSQVLVDHTSKWGYSTVLEAYADVGFEGEVSSADRLVDSFEKTLLFDLIDRSKNLITLEIRLPDKDAFDRRVPHASAVASVPLHSSSTTHDVVASVGDFVSARTLLEQQRWSPSGEPMSVGSSRGDQEEEQMESVSTPGDEQILRTPTPQVSTVAELEAYALVSGGGHAHEETKHVTESTPVPYDRMTDGLMSEVDNGPTPSQSFLSSLDAVGCDISAAEWSPRVVSSDEGGFDDELGDPETSKLLMEVDTMARDASSTADLLKSLPTADGDHAQHSAADMVPLVTLPDNTSQKAKKSPLGFGLKPQSPEVKEDYDRYYFSIVECIAPDEKCKEEVGPLIRVELDKRMRVLDLKDRLSAALSFRTSQSVVSVDVGDVDLRPHEFSLMKRLRSITTSGRFGDLSSSRRCGWPITDETQRMKMLKDVDIQMKLGYPLKEGEAHVRVLMFDVKEAQEKWRHLFDIVATHDSQISDLIVQIRQMLLTTCQIDAAIERIRIRKPTAGNLEWLEDRLPNDTYEEWKEDLIVELLPESILSKPRRKVAKLLFVRQFFPSSLTVGPIHQLELVTVCPYSATSEQEDTLFAELLDEISRLSNLPLKDISLAKLCGNRMLTFPYETGLLSLLERAHFRTDPPLKLEMGEMVYFRDETEMPKLLSAEERRQFEIRDTNLLRRRDSTQDGVTSRRRERGLRIRAMSSSMCEDDPVLD